MSAQGQYQSEGPCCYLMTTGETLGDMTSRDETDEALTSEQQVL